MKQVAGVALVLLLLAFPPFPAGASAQADGDLDRLLDDPAGHHVYDVGGVRYYAATLRLAGEERATGASPALLQKLEASGLSIAYLYHHLAAVGVVGTREGLKAAAALPEVSSVELAPVMVPTLDVSARAIKARPSTVYPGQDAGGRCGRGVVVAVLDTGVDDSHESLYGKFVAGVDVSNTQPAVLLPPLNEGNPDDDNLAFGGVNVNYDAEGIVDDPTTAQPPSSSGALFAGLTHGTHVSSTVLGTGGPTERHQGVAPCAKLVDVKVLTGSGVGVGPTAGAFQNPFGAQAGIEWVLDYNAGKTGYGDPGADRVRVINLSIAAQCTDAADPKETALDALVNVASEEHDIVVVAAAGNCGALGIRAPGTARAAVTVGALDDKGTILRTDDAPAAFSGRPNVAQQLGGVQKPDVAAPGVSITAAQGTALSRGIDLLDPLGFGFLLRQVGDAEAVALGEAGTSLPMAVARLNAYHALSGTSMAAPHVSGVAALILESYPHLSARQVKEAIVHSASGPGFWTPAMGWGSVDAYAALGYAAGLSPEGAAPDVAILEPRADTQVPPSCSGSLRLLARANSGTLASVTLQVDDGPVEDVTADLDADGGYSRSFSLAGTHEFRVRAVNSYGRADEDVVFAAGCQGVPGTRFPSVHVGASDRVIAYLTAGTAAGVVAPDGRALLVRYVPASPDPAAVQGAVTNPNVANLQDALGGAPIVATLKLDGTVTARFAQGGGAVDPARLQVVGGSLVGGAADGTWIVKGSHRRVGAGALPGGIQVTVAGKTFDNVASPTSCPQVSSVNSEPIEGTGEGAAAGDQVSPVKLWNWHVQDKPRYDTSCSGAVSAVAGVSAPEESPYQAQFFAQEAIL